MQMHDASCTTNDKLGQAAITSRSALKMCPVEALYIPSHHLSHGISPEIIARTLQSTTWMCNRSFQAVYIRSISRIPPACSTELKVANCARRRLLIYHRLSFASILLGTSVAPSPRLSSRFLAKRSSLLYNFFRFDTL